MRVTIDSEACQGHARCHLRAPDVFRLDEYGHAIAPEGEVPDELAHDVELAIANCPEGAIALLRDE